MMDYETLRHFADSWGLVYMVVVFLAVVLFLLRPKAAVAAREAAMIPFREQSANDQAGKARMTGEAQ